MGFEVERWQELADALRQHVIDHEAVGVIVGEYGTRYQIEGELKTPRGRAPVVRSIWIVPNEALAPQLVTAYPGRLMTT